MQAPVPPTPGSCGLSDHPCRKAIEGGGQLADILAGMPEIAEALDENGRNKGRDTTVTQFQGDRLVTVRPPEKATAKPVLKGFNTPRAVLDRRHA